MTVIVSHTCAPDRPLSVASLASSLVAETVATAPMIYSVKHPLRQSIDRDFVSFGKATQGFGGGHLTSFVSADGVLPQAGSFGRVGLAQAGGFATAAQRVGRRGVLRDLAPRRRLARYEPVKWYFKRARQPVCNSGSRLLPGRLDLGDLGRMDLGLFTQRRQRQACLPAEGKERVVHLARHGVVVIHRAPAGIGQRILVATNLRHPSSRQIEVVDRLAADMGVEQAAAVDLGQIVGDGNKITVGHGGKLLCDIHFDLPSGGDSDDGGGGLGVVPQHATDLLQALLPRLGDDRDISAGMAAADHTQTPGAVAELGEGGGHFGVGHLYLHRFDALNIADRDRKARTILAVRDKYVFLFPHDQRT